MPSADLLLGKLPPRRCLADVAIKARPYIFRALPATPATWAWGSKITFGMFLNDRYGDCTCAAIGHLEQVHSTRNKHAEHPSDAYIFELYHNTGVEQHLGDDDGRYMEGVLSHLRRVGLRQSAGDPDNQPDTFERIIGYAGVNPLDIEEVRAAGYLFGGLYAGLALPLSAMSQTGRAAWSCQSKDNAPGSWGGHAVTVTAINSTGPVVATWAHRQQLTWCFWKRYVDECYAVLTDDWVAAQGKAPSGFARDELARDLEQIG